MCPQSSTATKCSFFDQVIPDNIDGNGCAATAAFLLCTILRALFRLENSNSGVRSSTTIVACGGPLPSLLQIVRWQRMEA